MCLSTLRGLEDMARVGARHRVIVTLETVSWGFLSTPEVALWIERNRQNSHLGFTLDVFQAARAGSSVEQFLTVVGPDLAHLHCCDFSPDTARRLYPGRGTFDFPRLKQQLTEHRYKGAIVLETHPADATDNLSQARQQLAIFDNLDSASGGIEVRND